jgi:ribosomal protein L9
MKVNQKNLKQQLHPQNFEVGAEDIAKLFGSQENFDILKALLNQASLNNRPL